VQEGEVVVGLAIATGGDATAVLQPGVGSLDRPALASKRVCGSQPAPPAPPHLSGRRPFWDRLAGAPRLRDTRLDLTQAQGVLQRLRGIAAISP